MFVTIVAAGVALSLCALPGVLLAATAKSASSKVTAVRFWSLGDVTRVAIEVSSEFKYRSEKLTNPDRLVFDIQGAKPEMGPKGMHVIAVDDALLKQLRVAETQPGVTRVVLDLAQPVDFTASQLSNPDRLMLEIKSKDHQAPAATSTSGVRSLTDSPSHTIAPDLVAAAPVPSAIVASPVPPPPAPVAVALKPEPKRFDPPPLRAESLRAEAKPELIGQPLFAPYVRQPKDPLPPPSVKPDPSLIASSRSAGLLRPVTLPEPTIEKGLPEKSSAKLEPVVKDPVIKEAIIKDPGPKEPIKEALPAKNGARSLTRVLGLKLGRVVIDPGHGGHDMGTHGPSGLTEKEVVLDVARRLGTLLEDRLASEVVFTRSDDTFIPLEERTHIANEHKADLFLSIHANSSPYRTAAGVETYYLNFTTSKAALDLAARENATSDRSVFDLKEILQKIALKDKIDESREFATSLQTALYSVSAKGNVAAKNRGIKRAPFVVLIGASMPSVLAEIGFLTNPADEALMKKPDQRQKIAEALYKGVAGYAETLSHFQVAKSSGGAR